MEDWFVYYGLKLTVGYPIGFIRWLFMRKKTLKEYAEDTEYNLTAFGIIMFVLITSTLLIQMYFVPTR